tara:strand:+ start:3966 stop:5207 length:1242 start_codon:yes stop_codon:yes gene_type:complete
VAEALQDAATPAANPLDPLVILVVDDDPAFRYICARALFSSSRYAYQPVEADSAEQALDILVRRRVDGLLVDYGLPGMSGADLMQQVRLLHEHRHTAMVAMTASGSEEVAAEVLRAGASDYISKSAITDQSLCRAIGNALERASLHNAVHDRAEALEKANQQLQKRNDEIARFYQTVSHETKTPLTAAMLFLSMLEKEVAGPINADQKQMVQQATASCRELARHLDALIDSTRLEAGKMNLELEDADLANVVERAVAGVRPGADAKDIDLRVTVDGNIPPFAMDGPRIVQVLGNLLGNAVKFTPAGGCVELEAKRVPAVCSQIPNAAGDVVEIDIRDTGIGIDADDLPRIFDRLYQVGDKGDAAMGAGLGLGLTIAKEIIDLHRGRISVTSAVGEGTTFSVALKLESVDEQGA